MVRVGMCVACQLGDHKRHQRVIQSVPEGMMGGAICGCEGECDGKPSGPFRRQVDSINAALRRARETARGGS